MKKVIPQLPLFLLLIIIGACQSQVKETTSIKGNKFEDPEIVKIYELIDKRDADSLIVYLKHTNSTYRYEAALGFGSLQDTSVIHQLAFSLNDSSAKVRKASAYALGQTRDSSAIQPIVNALELEDSVYVRKELLESLGKVITQEKLSLLQYWPLKTQEDKEGLAWGLYRAGVRNVFDGVSIDLALSLLDTANAYETRLGAAHFLSRTRNLMLEDRNALIIRSATQDMAESVRMASTLGLRNAKHPSSIQALESIMKDKDYRVRVNALRALSVHDIEDTKTILFRALEDSSEHVAATAAAQLNNKATLNELDLLKSALSNSTNYLVRSSLYGTILSLANNKKEVIDAIIQEYTASTDSYYKADLLSALGNSALASEFIITEAFSENPKVICTAGISALAAMRTSKDFPSELINSFGDVFKEAIKTKDVGMIFTSASVITNPNLGFKDLYDSAKFLKSVRQQLQLPQDMEAIQTLERAIAYFENTEYKSPQNEYNHSINWDLVKSLGSNPIAKISTNKGDIEIRLMVEDAPGSVANFAALAKSGYYDGKNFHRVVPNFVIQGGCNRGDGFGGEDYSIRSELANIKYEEGSVGMASAGKDTEGTQWFITHSPTPHLDGGYTIFAKVQEGMEVVHAIEKGDKINSITIL